MTTFGSGGGDEVGWDEGDFVGGAVGYVQDSQHCFATSLFVLQTLSFKPLTSEILEHVYL